MPRPASDNGSVTAELALALPTVTMIIFVALGATALQLEKMKLVSVAGAVARGAARGEPENSLRLLANELRPGTKIELEFEPAKICAKAFFDVNLVALGGNTLEVADRQCARTSGL